MSKFSISRIVCAAVLVCCFAANAALADEKAFVDLSKSVPENSLVYVEVNDIPKIKEDFFKLGFWKDGKDARKVIGGLIDELFDKIYKQSAGKIQEGFIEKHLDNLHSIRFVLVDLNRLDMKQKPDLFVQIVFNDKKVFEEFLNNPEVKKNLKEEANRNGMRIFVDPKGKQGKDRDFFMGAKDNLMYIAMSETRLKMLLGWDKFGGKSLAENADFKRISKQAKGAGFFGYVNLPEILSIFGDVDKMNIPGEAKTFLKDFVRLKSFGMLHFAAWYDRGWGYNHFTIEFRDECPIYENIRQEPVDQSLIKFFPKNIIAGSVTSTKDIQKTWTFIKKIFDNVAPPQINEQMQGGLAQFEKKLGFKLEEILEAAKGEVGFIMTDFPLPKPEEAMHGGPDVMINKMLMGMGIAVRVSDPDKVKKIIDAAIKLAGTQKISPEVERNLMVMKKETYRDVEIMSFGEEVFPRICFAWVDDVLLASFAVTPVKKMIDANKDKTSILEVVDKDSMEGMPKKTSMLGFSRPIAIIAQMGIVPEKYIELFKENVIIFQGIAMEKKRLVIYSNSPAGFGGGSPFIIAAIAIPSLLQSRLASQDQAAIANMKALLTANTTFNTMKAGQSAVFEDKYYGYCKQTMDLATAEIETAEGIEKILGVDKSLCAEDGANGNSGGYYFRYIVTKTSVKSDGLDNVTGFMIVAWPETIGRTGTRVYITNEQGIVYYRSACADDEGEDPPVTEWPDVEAEDSDWKDLSKMDARPRRGFLSGIASNDKSAVFGLKVLQTANTTFNVMKAGLSDKLDEQYYGYCKQTIDLINSEITTADGVEKIKGVDKELCAEDGENAMYEGYYFRYIVRSTSIKSDGRENVTSYMIVAWPETVGKTGTRVYITSEEGTIYYRPATADDEGQDPPVTEWPDVDAEDSDWRSISGFGDRKDKEDSKKDSEIYKPNREYKKEEKKSEK